MADTTRRFEAVDARTGLQTRVAELERCVDVVVTSPPYFGARDYRPEGTGGRKRPRLGANHTGGDATQLGHEATPYAFARNLAAIFGAAASNTYLKDTGSLWIVLGDTFARRNFTDTDGAHAPIKKREAISIHHLFTYEMRMLGWRLWQEVVWHKPAAAPSGAAQARCNPCHEYILVFAPGRPRFFPRAVREPGKTKAGTVMPPVGGKKYGDYTKRLVSDGKRTRQDVWTICPSRSRSAHVAPFPATLVETAILATTERGDWVCDPFAGIQTTAQVCDRLGRNSISFDIYDHVGAAAAEPPAKRACKKEPQTDVS